MPVYQVPRGEWKQARLLACLGLGLILIAGLGFFDAFKKGELLIRSGGVCFGALSLAWALLITREFHWAAKTSWVLTSLISLYFLFNDIAYWGRVINGSSSRLPSAVVLAIMALGAGAVAIALFRLGRSADPVKTA